MALTLPLILEPARNAAGLALHRLFGAEEALPGCEHPAPPAPEPAPRPSGLQRLARMLRRPARRRYDTPWMLLVGEPGSGKSSLAASVAPALRASTMAWPESWLMAATRCWRMEQGVLVDPDGKVAAAGGRPWRAALRTLAALRPERPVDGVVIVVAAHTLATAAPDALAAAAILVRRQLDSIQDVFGFALPAYVVIAGADKVAGFSAYWQAVADVPRSAMLGWSMPTGPDTGTPAQWAATAFQALADGLRTCLVRAAATTAAALPQADDFFLFPYHVDQLRGNFTRWMEIVFQPSSLPGGYLMRGAYLAGSVAADGKDSKLLRADVDFVDDLVSRKVLGERNLARPTRASIWARSRMLRLLQTGIGATLLALFLGLLQQSWTLLTEADDLVRATAPLLRVETAAAPCLDQAQAFALLARLEYMHPALDYLPWSALSDRAGRRAAQLAAERTLAGVLLPSLQCQLSAQADKLLAFTPSLSGATATPAESNALIRHNLYSFLDQLVRLEAAANHLKELEEKRAAANPERAVQALNEVISYVYGTAPPGAVRTSSAFQDWLEQLGQSFWKALGVAAPAPHQSGERPWMVDSDSALYWALRELHAPVLQGVSPVQRTGMRDQIVALSDNLGPDLEQLVGKGSARLTALVSMAVPGAKAVPPATLLSTAREAHDWLSWVNTAWLPATAQDNPCQQLAAGLQARARLLAPYKDTLDKAIKQFDTTLCYDTARTKLTEMKVAPLDKIVDAGPPHTFGSKVRPELEGLAALLKEGFMEAAPLPSFSCNSTSQLAPAGLKRAAAYATAWLNFQKLRVTDKGGDGAPRLYAGLGLQQLKQVMSGALGSAQQEAAGSGDGADAVLSQASSQFSAALPAVDEVLALYEQVKLPGSATVLRDCVRSQAGNALVQVNALKNKLYETPAGLKDGVLFNLGDSAALTRSLDADLARVKVLAGYAAPYAKFLSDHATASDAATHVADTNPYWNNTVKELNQALAGDAKGQVGRLNDFFSKTLLGITSKTCSKALDGQTGLTGDDLFSASQRLALEQANSRCRKTDNTETLKDYTRLRERFDELAGHYPFGDSKNDALKIDAVRKFFGSYGKDVASLRAKVDAMAPEDDPWAARRDFLVQLDDAATSLHPLLTGDAQVTLSITFNARSDESPGASEVVNWSVSNGTSTVSWPRQSPASLVWSPGKPLNLELEWAKTSPWRPAARASHKDLQVHGVKATFIQGSDDWALLHLLAAHRDDNSDDTHAYAFQVPIAPATAPAPAQGSDVARLFLGLTASVKDAKTGIAAPLKLPASFPANAPR